MNIAEDLAEFMQENKYKMSFFYHAEQIGHDVKLGDKQIGCHTMTQKRYDEVQSAHLIKDDRKPKLDGVNLRDTNFLLCLRGGVNPIKSFLRLPTIDDPCRKLSYYTGGGHDAIKYVP